MFHNVICLLLVIPTHIRIKSEIEKLEAAQEKKADDKKKKQEEKDEKEKKKNEEQAKKQEEKEAKEKKAKEEKVQKKAKKEKKAAQKQDQKEKAEKEKQKKAAQEQREKEEKEKQKKATKEQQKAEKEQKALQKKKKIQDDKKKQQELLEAAANAPISDYEQWRQGNIAKNQEMCVLQSPFFIMLFTNNVYLLTHLPFPSLPSLQVGFITVGSELDTRQEEAGEEEAKSARARTATQTE